MAGQGTTILASDFNAIQSIIANVLGTGSGSTGYGQPVTSSQVTVGGKITAVGWQKLRNDLLAARQHQTGNDESGNLTPPSTGILVREYDRAAYLAYAQLIQANQYSVGTGQSSPATLSNPTRTTPFTGTLTHQVTLNFGSANAARYFFNSGSNIQFSASLTGSPQGDNSTTKSNDFATLLSGVQTITFNYNSTTTSNPGGSNQTIASSVGFYQLTTSQQLLFRKTTSSPTYTNNQYDIYAQIDGTGSVVTFFIKFQDTGAGSNPSGYNVDWQIEGNLNSTVITNYASGSNVSMMTPNPANPSLTYFPTVTQSGP